MAWSCLVLGALVAQTAHATVVKRAGLAELAQGSDVIVHAAVQKVDDALATSKDGPFRTRVELELVEVVKGLPATPSTLTLELPGGRAFGRQMIIPGMPTFHEGDELVLLLERTARGYALAGLAQGVFYVDRSTPEPAVRRSLGGATYVGPNEHLLEDDAPHTLSRLLDVLRALVAKEGR